jgi:2-dehydropantoate 2-reductase
MAQRALNANMDKGIYILGLGNMGKYVGYALMNSRNQQHMKTQLHDLFPPVTLLFHRPGLVADWENAGSRISYTSELALGHQPITDDVSRPARLVCSTRFHTELIGASTTESEPAIIKHLIVATKTHATTAALASIKHRLSKDSHVMFLQNGMGTSLTVP